MIASVRRLVARATQLLAIGRRREPEGKQFLKLSAELRARLYHEQKARSRAVNVTPVRSLRKQGDN